MSLTPVLLDAVTRREHIRRKAMDGVRGVFPLPVRGHTLEVDNLHVNPKDFSSGEQKKAILEGRTLQEPLRGDVLLRNDGGKIVERKKNVTLAQLPYFTQRHTFIVDGNEYSVANQRRVRPGVYTRVRGNEELEAAFNLGKGENFRINMDPTKGHLFVQYGSSNIPLYPVLRKMGVSKAQLSKHWGQGVVDQNRDAFHKKTDASVSRLYERLVPASQRQATGPDAQAQEIVRRYKNTSLDPEVMQRTLGVQDTHVTPQTLVRASQKLLDVHRQGVDTDDRDSLANQTLHSVDDFLQERIRLEGRTLAQKIKAKAGRGGRLEIDQVVPASPFTGSVRKFITNASLSAIPTQTNPVEIIDSAMRVTNLGEGGISTERAVPNEARDLHPTHMGFLDPMRSPESFRVGIDLRSALWTKRDDKNRVYSRMRNVRTGVVEDVPISKMENATVAFPGESAKQNGISAMRRGEIISTSKKNVDYEIPHPTALFSPATNTVPFVEGMQGNRVMMGAKMATQALPLLGREEPLVQVASYNPGRTMEQEIARLIVPTTPTAGTVKKIDGDYIYIQPSLRKKASVVEEGEGEPLQLLAEEHHVLVDHTPDDLEKTGAAPLIKIPYDTNFPLASKTYLHNTVKVKPGDEVSAHQPLADSNFTRNDKLALGRNMNVGYMSYYGKNSNDAVVISESAAKKLTSEHMYKESLPVSPDITLDKEKHRSHYGNRWTAAQYENLDAKGVAKPGMVINPGDPLIMGLRKVTPTAEQKMLGKLHKSLALPFKEQVVTWEHRNPGRVLDVVNTPNRTLVTVKTEESAGVGDKLCFTQETEVLTKDGWKDVADITVQDVIYTVRDETIELQEVQATHYYPTAGELYELWSQQVELRVTPNHALYIKQRNSNVFERVPATEAFGKRCRHKKDGVWLGVQKTPKTFTPPACETISTGKGVQKSQDAAQRLKDIPMDAWLRFLGAYLADGSTTIHERSDRNSTEYRVDLHAYVGTEHSISGPKHETFRAYLDACGFHYTEREDRFQIHCKQLAYYLKQFGKAPEKHVPPEVFQWGPEAASWLLEGLLSGDGSRTQSNSLAYTTVSPRLADDVQRLALHHGWSANIKVKPAQEKRWSTRYRVQIVRKKNTPQINHGHTNTQNGQTEQFIKTDEPVWGVTVPNGTLYVRVNGKPVWTGNSGRFGNKGVISEIIPDDKMVQTPDGKPVDILATSAGVVSRVNPAQIIETAVAKVAKKTGKPLVVPSMSGRDNVKWARGLLKKHGVSDKEVLYNPVTGRHIKGPDGKGVMVGPQYTYKLFKLTETNYGARGVEDYDVNLQPAKGGETGAKSLGRMEVNAILGHNARNVLKEATSLKGSRNDEWWRAYQLGLPLPPMKTSFAYDKFAGMLGGAGIRIDKAGDTLRLGPMTDAEVKKRSAGAITKALMVKEKDLTPERGGLFDPVITGGANGERWSHFDLAEPIVNPTFEDPVRRMLNMTTKQYRQAVRTEGGAGIRKALKKIDLDKRESELEAVTRKANGSVLDGAVKQLKAVRALKEEKLRPEDAYILSKMPVVPPRFRPILPSQGKRDLLVSDANYLYRDTMLANETLKEAKGVLPADAVGEARSQLYDATRATFGLADPVSPQLKGRSAKGHIATITGQGSPKHGFFHSKLIKKTQDLTGRGTAAPDLSLGMDQVGLPEDMLWKTYEPHIMRGLVQQGHRALDAKQMIEERRPAARNVLMTETQRRPVIVNRAPTLHRHGMVGAYPVPVPGKTIRVNPFIEGGLGLDYDGDCSDCYLDTYQKGCYTQIHISEFPRVEESVQRKDNKETYGVPPGTQVFSYDEETGKVVLRDVTHFSIHHNLEMLNVTLSSKRHAKVSRDASMYAVNPETWRVERVSAEDAIGWATPRPRQLHQDRTVQKELSLTLRTWKLDADLGWFLGAFVGDGWLGFSQGRWNMLGFSKNALDVKEEYIAYAQTLIEDTLSVKKYDTKATDPGSYGDSTKYHLNSAELARKVAEIMDGPRGPEGKHLPRCFVNAPREFLLGLLGGLIDTDGSIAKVKAKAKPKPQWIANYTTVSERLADEICVLLTMLGVRSSVTPNKKRAERRQAYTITFSMPDLVRLAHEIPLVNAPKREKLQQMVDEFDPDNVQNARWDVIPISSACARALSRTVGCPKVGDTPEKKARKTLYIQLHKAIQDLRLSRLALRRAIDCLGTDCVVAEGGEAWFTLVTNENIFFDFIEAFEKIPGRHTAWDLTVPGSNTFMTSNQIIVYDTLQIHVPATPEAVQDIKSMTLSNNLFGDKNRSDLMVFPQHEAILGIYTASAAKGGKTHTFKSQRDALAAYKRGDIGLHDSVKIG